MRKLFLGLLLATVSHSSFAAINISCRAIDNFGWKEEVDRLVKISFQGGKDGQDTSNHGYVVYQHTYAICKDKKDNMYAVLYRGIGASIKVADTAFRVVCPLVAKQRIDDPDYDGTSTSINPDGRSDYNEVAVLESARFVGVNTSATAGIGLSMGVFMNHGLGVCFVPGFESKGIGVSATGGVLNIVKFQNQEGMKEKAKDYFKSLKNKK